MGRWHWSWVAFLLFGAACLLMAVATDEWFDRHRKLRYYLHIASMWLTAVSVVLEVQP